MTVQELMEQSFGYKQPSIEERTGIVRPQMTNLLDFNGLLDAKYRLNARPDVNLNVNTQALEELRKRGFAQGPSEYANILTQKQALEEQNALGKAGRSAASASSSAFSDIARRGGLSSGARERLASQSAMNALLGQQDVLRQGMGDRLNITASDEQQKLGILQSLPGMELGLGQARANTDIANRAYQTDVEKLNKLGALQEVGRQDAAKLREYEEKMKAYGAEKTADAQANAGKK